MNAAYFKQTANGEISTTECMAAAVTQTYTTPDFLHTVGCH